MKIKRVIRVCRELEEYLEKLTQKYDEEAKGQLLYKDAIYKDIIYHIQEILREDFDELS